MKTPIFLNNGGIFMNFQYSGTVAAISTAMSDSGIGIVRMTGNESFEIADKVYAGKNNKVLSEQKSHTIHYGYIKDGEEVIDEVLVMLMRGPHSYTGEDTVEINCHGGVYVVKKILEVLLKNGAFPAQPGEFTKRAFLNGRIDLSQAEAVGDLISAQNEYAHKSSVSQLKGNVKDKIQSIRQEIIYHTAFIESALDDPEHISVDGYGEKLKKDIDRLKEEIENLLYTCDNGRMIKEGIKTVIAGKPNAGKSSLLNALLGEERAIVTEMEGTTRDVLEEHINLKGISLNIMDTAGIRDTNDVAEKIGVDRARGHVSEADLVLCVIDSSKSFDDNDRNIFQMISEKKTIILLNKSDLDRVITKEELLNELELAKEKFMIGDKSNTVRENEVILAKNVEIIEISAKNRDGIDELENKIKHMFFEGEISFNNEIYITNARHKNALSHAIESLCKVCQSIEDGMPEDFYSIDLMGAYESLGNITGETIGEDLVNEIFSKFCMGK